MLHFDILTMVVVLMTGAASFFYFNQNSRHFPDPGLKTFQNFIVVVSVFSLEFFLVLYFNANLNPEKYHNFIALLKGVDWPLKTLLVIVIFLYQFKIIAWLRQKKWHPLLITGIISWAALLMVLYLPTHPLGIVMPQNSLVNYWTLLVWPINFLEIGFLGKLYVESMRRTEPAQQKAGKAFVWFFLVHILIQLILIILGTNQLLIVLVPLARLLSIYTLLIPALWLKYFYIPFAGSLSNIINRRVNLDSLQQIYGLSNREMEVLKLMVDGKSYKEIESVLNISIHTVKSHVYNLYRKIGVSSRHQLIHRISLGLG